VLKYHPDKNTEISDEAFKKIQGAFDTLSDPRRRRIFDSSDDDGDVVIPNYQPGDNFYALFGSAFRKISRFSSSKKKMPSIGDDNTPLEAVREFYNWWVEFKSWRDFSYLDEYDLEDAESRDERRWMDRQNDRERKRHKKEESAKIVKLAELAEKMDPRLVKHRDAEKNKKNKVREDRERAVREKKEAEEKAIAEAAAKKLEEEKKKKDETDSAKKAKVNADKKMRKQKNRMRSAVGTSESIENVEFVCARLDINQINEVLAGYDESEESGHSQFVWFLHDLKEKDKNKATSESSEKEKEASKPWTDAEISLLAKAVAKFPGGTTDRWDHISTFVGTRSVKEIISKTKETKVVPNKPTNLAVTDAFERFNQNKKKSDEAPEIELSTAAPAATPSEAHTNGNGQAAEQTGDWTPAEQKALEKALSSIPSTEMDRWDLIAAAVPGKTKKDCIARYKFLVAQIKDKKVGK